MIRFSCLLLLLLLSAESPAIGAEKSAPQEKKDQNSSAPNTLGTEDLERPDGGKDRFYFSIVPQEEEKKNREEEKEKMEKSLDVLKNIIIDRHRSP